jgi:arylsulfatase A-like enzyme
MKWLLMLHTYEIHAPYVREPFYTPDKNQTAGEVIARYDSGIRYTDQKIGKIIETLKAEGIYDNTIIIVMSDHGERFVNQFTGKAVADKMGLHGYTLYNCETHVPLIISGGPASEYAGKHISAMTNLVDLLPSMLSLVDIKIPGNIRGVNLMRFINDEDKIEDFSFSERYLNQKTFFSIRSDQHKLIIQTDAEGKKTAELYNTQIDPEEAFNIAGNSLKIERQMKIKFEKFMTLLSDAQYRYMNLLLKSIE